MKKVWFITGASKGLGLAFTKHLLEQGHLVAATSRKLSGLASESSNFLPLQVDLSEEKSITEAVAKVITKFKTIDVLVNNAGFGQGGAVEEVSDALARENFEVNVFGLLNVTRAILPIMRKNKRGHVMNISSIGGFSGDFSGFGIYCGTKFAVAGITEGLSADLKPLGIHTTLIYPGYFRTEFLTSDSFSGPDNVIADYSAARIGLDVHANSINHNQNGDPMKAAAVLLNLSQMEHPPLHMFLGPDSYEAALKEIEVVKKDMEQFVELSKSTNL
jgi:NAD(P)-dependent dehydrogenase (short-subunit alcohol dehydrogenase family)